MSTVEREGNSLSQVSLRSETSTLIGSQTSLRYEPSFDVIDSEPAMFSSGGERVIALSGTGSPVFVEEDGDDSYNRARPVSRTSGTASRRDSAVSESQASLRSIGVPPTQPRRTLGSQTSLRSASSRGIGSQISVRSAASRTSAGGFDSLTSTTLSTSSERTLSTSSVRDGEESCEYNGGIPCN